MKVGEYGVAFRHAVDYDLSTATALSLAFRKPGGAVGFTVSSPDVSVGATDYVPDDDGTFLTNQYAECTFQIGQVDAAGEWQSVLTADFGPDRRLISDPAFFMVDPA